MPVIDSAQSESAASQLLNYWAGKITALGAQSIAGVRLERTSSRKDEWDIVLDVYVSTDSEAYHDFVKRFM